MDGMLSETLQLYCHKTQEIKYRCYVIRNSDPINALKLKKIRYRWCGIRSYYPMQIHLNTIK